MIWGIVFPNGKVFFKKMFGKQNSEKYKIVLSSFTMPAMESKYGKYYIFQQDNCSIHVSVTWQISFEESAISLLKWPARYLDMDLMGNVWKMAFDQLYSMHQNWTIE